MKKENTITTLKMMNGNEAVARGAFEAGVKAYEKGISIAKSL